MTTREAERLAKEAAGLVPDDMLTLRANVLFDLSEVLATVGQSAESADIGGHAIAVFEFKGNRSGAENARAAISRF